MLFKIHKSDILKLAEIVREETGNQVLEKNYSMLESRIRGRILSLNLESMVDYWSYFEIHQNEERAAIQSLMTTHYTFFFREFVHFEILEKWIHSNLDRLKKRFQNTGTPLKIWSAACSRGQEVYSLATFLEVQLFQKFDIPYTVLGTDLDHQSVSYALNGVYPLKEVNTIPQIYLNSFWRRGRGPVKDFAAVHQKVKDRVRFETLNLLEYSHKDSLYDIIFCRNVFIYFSEENVTKIARELSLSLNPQGLLISGLSEPLRNSNLNLNPVGPSCYEIIDPINSSKVTSTNINHSKPTSMPSAKNENVLLMNESSISLTKEVKYRVLCVDDSPTIQKLIKMIFSVDSLCEGVDIANNGQEAREKLNQNKYDLITLDIHMPVVGGIEFLEKLYNRKKDPPVVMISSVNRSDVDLATKSLELGAFDYVEKPSLNNLSKSQDEILAKAKLALRATKSDREQNHFQFDKSISEKILIPDSSLCLRVILTNENSLESLRYILEGQKNELRSPPFIILWLSENSTSDLESKLIQWTEHSIINVRTENQNFKPNNVYILNQNLFSVLELNSKDKNVSIQILCQNKINFSYFKNSASIQILIEEKFSHLRKDFDFLSNTKISEICPSTSFGSLSVEFFSNLRKATA